MELSLQDIRQNKTVKDLQDKARFLLMSKKEMYNTLLAVQEVCNRNPKFVGDKPHELDMVEKMNGLGFNIK